MEGGEAMLPTPITFPSIQSEFERLNKRLQELEAKLAAVAAKIKVKNEQSEDNNARASEENHSPA